MPVFTITSLRDQIQSDLSNAPVTSSFGSTTFAPDGSPVTGGQVIGPLAPVNFSANSGGNPSINQSLQAHRSINVSSFGSGQYRFFIAISTTGNATTIGGISGNGPVRNFSSGVLLPLAHPLVDTLSVEYEQYPFGPGWGTALQGSGAGIAAALGQAAAQAGAGAIAGETGRNLVNTLGTALTTMAGLTVNQFYTVLLKGPKFKSYQFEWHLLPQNQQDSIQIRNIIRDLRAAASPELVGPGGFFWQFPNVVRCAFTPQGTNDGATPATTPMYMFKPAVMTEVSAQYAPLGTAFYRNSGGYPESIRLQIHFFEIEYWLQRDFA